MTPIDLNHSKVIFYVELRIEDDKKDEKLQKLRKELRRKDKILLKIKAEHERLKRKEMKAKYEAK